MHNNGCQSVLRDRPYDGIWYRRVGKWLHYMEKTYQEWLHVGACMVYQQYVTHGRSESVPILQPCRNHRHPCLATLVLQHCPVLHSVTLDLDQNRNGCLCSQALY